MCEAEADEDGDGGMILYDTVWEKLNMYTNMDGLGWVVMNICGHDITRKWDGLGFDWFISMDGVRSGQSVQAKQLAGTTGGL